MSIPCLILILILLPQSLPRVFISILEISFYHFIIFRHAGIWLEFFREFLQFTRFQLKMKKKKEEKSWEGIFIYACLENCYAALERDFLVVFGGGFNFFYLLFYCSFIGGNLTYTQQTTSAECEAEGKGILVRLNWMISNKSQIVIVVLRTWTDIIKLNGWKFLTNEFLSTKRGVARGRLLKALLQQFL